jgi:LPXTG-motif cell wall-anchored protein
MVAQSSEVELANLPNTGAQGMQPGVVALLLMGAGTLLLSLRRVGRS